MRDRCESLLLQVQEKNTQLLKRKSEEEDLRNERLSLISEYELREGMLREEIATLKSKQSRRSELEQELEERVRGAEAGREDALAEVEILQARISELTREAELRHTAVDAGEKLCGHRLNMVLRYLCVCLYSCLQFSWNCRHQY